MGGKWFVWEGTGRGVVVEVEAQRRRRHRHESTHARTQQQHAHTHAQRKKRAQRSAPRSHTLFHLASHPSPQREVTHHPKYRPQNKYKKGRARCNKNKTGQKAMDATALDSTRLLWTGLLCCGKKGANASPAYAASALGTWTWTHASGLF